MAGVGPGTTTANGGPRGGGPAPMTRPGARLRRRCAYAVKGGFRALDGVLVTWGDTVDHGLTADTARGRGPGGAVAPGALW